MPALLSAVTVCSTLLAATGITGKSLQDAHQFRRLAALMEGYSS